MNLQKEDTDRNLAHLHKGHGLLCLTESGDGLVRCGGIQEVVLGEDRRKGGHVAGDHGTGGRAKCGLVIEDRVTEYQEIGEHTREVTHGEDGVDHVEIEHRRGEIEHHRGETAHRRGEVLVTDGTKGKDRERNPLEAEGVHVRCPGAHVPDNFP